MKIGMIGSRRRNTEQDKHIMRIALKTILDKCGVEVPVTIVSGGCKKGGDRFAEELAKEFNIPIKIHYPEVKKNCSKKEYAISCWNRNTLIADDSDILISLVAKDRKGGTEDTIKKFLRVNSREKVIILEEKDDKK
jgi:hypothetical protein